MSAAHPDDLHEIVSVLQHRAEALGFIGDGICGKGDRRTGDAVALMAADMLRDLETLAERIDSLDAGR